MSPGGKKKGQTDKLLKIKCKLETFRFVEEKPKKGADESEGKAKKSRRKRKKKKEK